MAKVFRAQFLFQESNISVTLMNMTGDILCCFQTQSETLQEFEMELVNPKGPMLHHLCGVTLLDFYTKAERRELDLSLPIRKFLLEELVFKQANLEISLKKFPDTGKFLEAMRNNKFLPSSKTYQGAWTPAKTREVPMYNARALVKEALDGLETHSNSHCEFVEIFGYLTSLGESWNVMKLEPLHFQKSDPGLQTLKHSMCQHWMDIARARATSMISRDVSPITLVFRNASGMVSGSSTLGRSFPSNFDRDLNRSLEMNDHRPSFDWTQVARVLVSLDWNNFQQDKIPSFEEVCMTAYNSDKLRGKFAKLLAHEILQMIHLQLALSCCGVARVEGPINEAWVEMVAELLCYRLMIVKSEEIDNLKIDHGEAHRGMLILVTHVSDFKATSRLELYAETLSTRMIISVDSVEVDKPALKRPRHAVP